MKQTVFTFYGKPEKQIDIHPPPVGAVFLLAGSLLTAPI